MASLDDLVTVGNSVNKNISQLILAITNFANLYNSVIAVANGGTGNSSLTANSVLTGNGINPIVAEPFLVFDDSARLGVGTASPTAAITIKAGTAAANTAPLKFTTGTNLTSVEAGVVEYDGTTFTASPSTSYGRATFPLISYTSGIGTSGATLNTDYALFPAANDTITLPIGTYLVRLRAVISVGSATAANLNINLRGAGNAVGTFSWDGVGGTVGATSGSVAAAVSPAVQTFVATALGTVVTVVTSTSVTNPRTYAFSGTGILKVTTAGTIIPSYQWSATLASITLYADNYMFIQTLDTQSAAAFGPAGAGWG